MARAGPAAAGRRARRLPAGPPRRPAVPYAATPARVSPWRPHRAPRRSESFSAARDRIAARSEPRRAPSERPETFRPRSRPSAPLPGQLVGLPARDMAALAAGVRRALEPVGDVVHMGEARCLRRIGRGQAARAAAAQEVDMVFWGDSRPLHLLDEARI